MTLKKIALMLLLLSSIVSCIKQPEDDEGVPASADEVQDSLATAWGEADPLSMTPKDYLFLETEQKIDSYAEPIFVLQEGITISKKEETAEEYKYTYLYQHRTFENGKENSASTREDHRSVTKATAAILVAQDVQRNDLKPMADDYQMTLGFERLYSLAYACYKSDSFDKYCKEELGVDSCDIKCSNLKVSEVLAPVPDLIKAQPNCGGFENCKIKKHTVAFDWTLSLTKNAEVQKQKVNYAITLSPDLPFFSRMTEYCFRRLYPVKGQKILVSTCTNLKNYKPGTP